MKTTFLILSILACYAVSSEMDYQDAQLKYNACLRVGSPQVYTDMDATMLEKTCANFTNYKELQ